jgi:hypothetical protein
MRARLGTRAGLVLSLVAMKALPPLATPAAVLVIAAAALLLHTAGGTRHRAAPPDPPVVTRTLTPTFLPRRGAELCDVDCFAYSASTKTWMCGASSSGQGMVHEIGERCSIQVLASASCSDGGSRCDRRWVFGGLERYPETIHIADAVVYRVTPGRRELTDAVTPLDAALRLAPPGLSSVQKPVPLAPGVEVAIPNSKLHLRLDEVTEESQINPGTRTASCRPRFA